MPAWAQRGQRGSFRGPCFGPQGCGCSREGRQTPGLTNAGAEPGFWKGRFFQGQPGGQPWGAPKALRLQRGSGEECRSLDADTRVGMA